jgi:uroporphyrinogen-III synthase
MARFPEDYNATTMARMMQNDGVHTAILHFCGDIRRPELTQAMTEASIAVHPVIVYEKQEVDFGGYFSDEVNLRRYLEHLSAVAFYSPTAVQAFFRQGLQKWFSGDYYVIGSTTMAALNAYGVVAQMPRVPTSELLIRYIYKRLSGGSA